MKNNNIKIINFFDLKEEQKLMVLEWRNNESIRRWMYNSNIISLKNHLSFIDSLQTDNTKKYYAVFKENQSIGVIYFMDIDNKKHVAEFGLYANPNLFGQGKFLMETIIEYGFKTLDFKTLYAEAFEKNMKAIDLYHRYNFNTIDTKIVGNINIICMERNN